VEQIPSGIRGRGPKTAKLSLADFELEPAESGHPEKITCPQGQTVAVTTSNHKKGLQVDLVQGIVALAQRHHARVVDDDIGCVDFRGEYVDQFCVSEDELGRFVAAGHADGICQIHQDYLFLSITGSISQGANSSTVSAGG